MDSDKVAIKVYTDWAMEEDNREVLHFETENLRSRQHPSICRYFESFFVTTNDLASSPLRDQDNVLPSSFAAALAANPNKKFDPSKARKCVVLEYCSEGSLHYKIQQYKVGLDVLAHLFVFFCL